MPADPAPDAGFTLLEVTVAFVIAAMAVAALVRGAGTGLLAARTAAEVQEGTARARSRLAALAAEPLRPGEGSGDDGGGFRWRTSVRVLDSSPRRAGTAAAPRPALYALTATVSWGEGAGRRVVLSTQAVGPAPPEGP